jgi:hypothetical protein
MFIERESENSKFNSAYTFIIIGSILEFSIVFVVLFEIFKTKKTNKISPEDDLDDEIETDYA